MPSWPGGGDDREYGTLLLAEVATGQVSRLDEGVFNAYWKR